MEREELIYWLALKMVPGVGNVTYVHLVERFGSPRAVFFSSNEELFTLPEIGRKLASEIKSFAHWKAAERELSRTEKEGVTIVTYRDPLYPPNLREIYDFPPFLYVRGSLSTEDINVAVVGSRRASAYGRYITDRLARELAYAGFTIVSGLARGIDSCAHQAAIAAKGRTIAVLGCGIDLIYPPENKRLFDTIPSCGAIVTEYPFGTPPYGPNFPARNRIISGLSLGVVIVEAGEKSGSLITARLALEQGREVFAVPGGIDTAGARGTNRLIKQGAKLVEGVEDIIEEITPQIKKRIPDLQKQSTKHPPPSLEDHPTETHVPFAEPQLTEGEKVLLSLISANPTDIDTLINNSGIEAKEILSLLLQLELKGLVTQLPGKRFIRKENLCPCP